MDENFPRGGMKPKEKQRERAHDNFNLFADFEKQKMKEKKKASIKQKLSKKAAKEDGETNIVTIVADSLTYKTIQDGMLILGCIHRITSLSIDVGLPGRTFGRIKINSISNQFTNFMIEEVENNVVDEDTDILRLCKIFKAGQFVPTKVIEKTTTEKGVEIHLSIKPDDVNSELNHTVFKPGMLLWAAVTAHLDHGYQLDVGVENCRMFLPHKNIDNNREFVMGEPMWCVVQKSDVSSVASTVTVTVLEKYFSSATQTGGISLHCLIPGMQVDFEVEKQVVRGIQGTFMGGFVGCINETQLSRPLESLDKYAPGQVLKARVLYIQPTTKLTYLTLRNLERVQQSEIAFGDIAKAKVLSSAGNGIYVKLRNTYIGFVSNKRLLQSLPKQSDADNPNEIIKRKFVRGSTHQCRVLDYNFIEQTYICTFERSVINEKYFSPKDIQIGQLLTVTIIRIVPAGLLVNFGKMEGFVYNLHISNVEYSENIKRKFSVGQKHQARVWIKDANDRIQLTLKHPLIETDQILTSYEEAIKNKQFPGVVIHFSKNGALIAFFGGVKGWLPASRMADLQGKANEFFYKGQVVTTTISNKDNGKISLSLLPPKPPKSQRLRIGQRVDAVVVNVEKDKILVEAGPKRIPAIIPSVQLCTNAAFAEELKKTYQAGYVIRDVLCIETFGKFVFSLREAKAYADMKSTIPNFDELQVGSIIRCLYNSDNEMQVIVTAHTKKFVRNFKIPKQDLVDNPSYANQLLFKPQQPIICKILAKDDYRKTLKLTAKLSKVFSYNFEDSINLFEQYLQDIDRIQTHLLAHEAPLSHFKLGDRVRCIVQRVSEIGGCSVLLPNKVQGLVDIRQCPANIKSGDEVEGVVLWVDYALKYVEVTLLPDVMENINIIQGGLPNTPLKFFCEASILLLRADYIIVLPMKKRAKGQLVFLPTHLHENDFIPNLQRYNTYKNIKIVVCKEVNKKLIGFDKKLLRDLKRIVKERVTSSGPNKRKNLDVITFESQNKKLRVDPEQKNYSKYSEGTGSKNKLLDVVDSCNEDSGNCDNSGDSDFVEEKSSIKNQETKSDLGIDEQDQDLQVTSEEDVEDSDGDGTDDEENPNNSEEEEDELQGDSESEEEEISQKDTENDSDINSDESEFGSDDDVEISDIDNEISDIDDVISDIDDVLSNKKQLSRAGNIKHKTQNEIVINSRNILNRWLEVDKKDLNLHEEVHIKTEDVEVKSEPMEQDFVVPDVDETIQCNNEDDNAAGISKENGCSTEKKKKKYPLKGKKKKVKSNKKDNNLLPGIDDFYNVNEPSEQYDSSSDDDAVKDNDVKKKKKKLSAAERAALARQQEEELIKKETERADAQVEPQSAEQFDRLLLAQPNSSVLWIKYIAHLASQTEIDKSRAIAEKAVATINFREEQEKLNVWISYMNLENRYGDKESFAKVFERALQCNDALEIYLQAIQILAESHKYPEMEEKIQKLRKHSLYKNNPRMWLEIGRVYYTSGRFDVARNMKNLALTNVQDKTRHVNLVVQFALLEFKYGEENEGEALFETVLQSFADRTDVWSTYLDQLVKRKKIETARRILERAVCQNLSDKKMKFLFKKFLDFEKLHGDEKKVMYVKSLVNKYVTNVNDKRQS